jgi:TolB protein
MLMNRRIRLSSVIVTAALLLPAATAGAQDAGDGARHPLFDGKTLDGWEGNPDYFRVEDGAIVAGSLSRATPRNEFLCTRQAYGDFELRVKVRLLGDPASANAGIQIRSRRIPNHNEMIGYQADMGQQYWGCLYDESRRNKILAQPDPQRLREILKPGDWNEYVIRCAGPRVQLRLNGVQTVDYTEPDASIEQSGFIGLQIHAGPPAEAWYKDIEIRTIGGALGLFRKFSDVGKVSHAGLATYDAGAGTYIVTGGGANIWGGEDAFHYVRRELSGDAAMTADVQWQGEGRNPHRKAGWMIRQNLEPGSPYVDAVVHGNGLISLQYRRTAGGPTEEIQSPVSGPATLRLERDGDVFTLSVSRDQGPFQPVGSLSVTLQDPVLAGLIVCSHDDSVTETAVFSNVELRTMGKPKVEDRVVESTLEIMSVQTGERKIVYRASRHFEAPNWSRDGSFLLFNSNGRLYTIPAAGGESKPLDTGVATKCNNDHGFSPDGKWLAISDQHDGDSRIYVLASSGGTPRLVTPLGPSYWHGWSPDGRTLAYCAARDNEYDVYTIGVEGGTEKRLTDAKGLDDGPDYSPDGRYIYFNSERSGLMHIWRMNADGSAPEQVTSDEDYADWFPHPSPDGKLLVWLSFDKSVQGHPANKDVALRIMDLPGGKPRALARLFGGQGTINVPSWSPDSKQVAFVSYRLIAP